MQTIKPHFFQGVKSGLVYGLGFIITSVLTSILFNIVDLTPVSAKMEAKLLIVGVLLALFIVAVSATVGSAIGSISLPLPADTQKSKWRKAWRGGLSMGPLFSLLIFLSGLMFSLFSFYNLTEISSLKFSFTFVVVGALFGGLSSWLLGLLLVRNHGVWQIVLAGLVGFGLGGLGLGEGVRQYLLTVKHANLETGNGIWLVTAYLFFGMVGGAALGFVFSYISQQETAPKHKAKAWHWVVAGILMVLLILFARPYINAIVELLTPRDADLAFVLDPITIGTHWSDSTVASEITAVAGEPQQPAIAANQGRHLAQVWLQQSTDLTAVYWLPGQWNTESRAANWQTPLLVSTNQAAAAAPQVVVDNNDISHIVWAESANIQYSQCHDGACSVPIVLSETAACATDINQQIAPSLAIDANDNLMAVWQADNGQLLYRTWTAGQAPAANVDCVPTSASETAVTPQLAAGMNGQFGLIYTAGDTIHVINFADGRWQTDEQVFENGRLPTIYLDQQDERHLAWCSDGGVHYQTDTGAAMISDLPCRSRPDLLADSSEALHLVWYGDRVMDVNGRIYPQTVLYESIFDGTMWTEPAIIQRTGMPTQPSATSVDDTLLMTWESTSSGQLNIVNANYIPYNCDDYPLTGISQIAYNTARDPEYRPSDAIIPYCQNQFQQLVFMPNPDPAFSDQPANPNGGFDEFAKLAQTAEYEVQFSTMWYEEDENKDSPGYVLASSISQLYKNLKANPELYPRGLTVRILLGNPPELALKEFSGQLLDVVADLRDAGVDKMVDPEIGWRLEIANFEGAMPHSHTKVMIVDGKTILAAGFNMQYEHYAVDHPSGLGKGRQDLGMMITGPIAQSSHRMFDDLWEGSNQLTCSNLYPIHRIWQTTCHYSKAITDHVPEVLKYYLPGGDSNAFSMYRDKDHDEADRIVEHSLAAAQNQIDAMHVMFAMDLECDLNLLFDLCDFGEATEYLQGLIQAAENGANIRLILKPQPMDGIENAIAYDIFVEELEKRGLRDQVEIRFFEDPIHYKTTLIDDQFLVVGSQNFHYSAFGQGEGLTEYSLGTNDVQAIADYKRLFEHQWNSAHQRE